MCTFNRINRRIGTDHLESLASKVKMSIMAGAPESVLMHRCPLYRVSFIQSVLYTEVSFIRGSNVPYCTYLHISSSSCG